MFELDEMGVWLTEGECRLRGSALSATGTLGALAVFTCPGMRDSRQIR